MLVFLSACSLLTSHSDVKDFLLHLTGIEIRICDLNMERVRRTQAHTRINTVTITTLSHDYTENYNTVNSRSNGFQGTINLFVIDGFLLLPI